MKEKDSDSETEEEPAKGATLLSQSLWATEPQPHGTENL